VVTPPAFAAGARYTVRLRGETPEAAVAGTTVFKTAVRIARARGRKRT
jgi:hypothetical protein